MDVIFAASAHTILKHPTGASSHEQKGNLYSVTNVKTSWCRVKGRTTCSLTLNKWCSSLEENVNKGLRFPPTRKLPRDSHLLPRAANTRSTSARLSLPSLDTSKVRKTVTRKFRVLILWSGSMMVALPLLRHCGHSCSGCSRSGLRPQLAWIGGWCQFNSSNAPTNLGRLL